VEDYPVIVGVLPVAVAFPVPLAKVNLHVPLNQAQAFNLK
jgi:hypothetical protein|tara:strand:+ start:484 stop:603 length:120 start_codon:yes stop_codon:yes gene_type:complete